MIYLPEELNAKLRRSGNASALICRLLNAYFKEVKEEPIIEEMSEDKEAKLKESIRTNLNEMMERETTEEEINEYLKDFKLNKTNMWEWVSTKKQQESTNAQLLLG